jgi:hypothetical protein
MKSERRGKRTSAVEVTNISPNGFWLLIAGRELFVPFEHFPWFRDASVAQLVEVQLPSAHHLYWPQLDVDLSVDSIQNPDRYPLVSRVQPERRMKPAAAQVRERAPSYRVKRRRPGTVPPKR